MSSAAASDPVALERLMHPRLESKLAELREEQEELRRPPATPGVMIGYGKRAGDHVAETADQLARARTAGELELVEDEVLAALQRMEAGSYGRCASCGAAIPVERLEALPWAVLCVQCKSTRGRGTGTTPRGWIPLP